MFWKISEMNRNVIIKNMKQFCLSSQIEKRKKEIFETHIILQRYDAKLQQQNVWHNCNE